MLTAIGALYFSYGARPSGLIIGGALVAVAVSLFGCVPLTDPYRHEQRRSGRR